MLLKAKTTPPTQTNIAIMSEIEITSTKPVIEERIYIGNVDYKATEEDLRDFFKDMNVYVSKHYRWCLEPTMLYTRLNYFALCVCPSADARLPRTCENAQQQTNSS